MVNIPSKNVLKKIADVLYLPDSYIAVLYVLRANSFDFSICLAKTRNIQRIRKSC